MVFFLINLLDYSCMKKAWVSCTPFPCIVYIVLPTPYFVAVLTPFFISPPYILIIIVHPFFHHHYFLPLSLCGAGKRRLSRKVYGTCMQSISCLGLGCISRQPTRLHTASTQTSTPPPVHVNVVRSSSSTLPTTHQGPPKGKNQKAQIYFLVKFKVLAL